MSQHIVDGGPSELFLLGGPSVCLCPGGSGTRSWWALRLVVAGRVDEVLGEDLAGGGIAGGDLAIIDQQQHSAAPVGGPDSQMAQPAGIADGDFAPSVHSIGACPEP